ncbi:MAG: hypothetical protein KGL39_05530 [Patescibacteria group bacterium]|nr:hypothetical protein [Patescibacteria group bacterium]
MKEITTPNGQRADLDLGDGHYLRFFRHQGVDHSTGGILYHPDPRSDTGWCSVGVYWERHYPEEQGKVTWTLQSGAAEPITLAPSIRCLTCGDHGFIRNGKWIRA